MSAWAMGYNSVKSRRAQELESTLTRTQSELRQAQYELAAYKTRDLLASVRLNQYGPMFIRMFDRGRDYKVEQTSDPNTSVTSTDWYDIVVENDLYLPCVQFRATKPIDGPGLSIPASLTIWLLYSPGSDTDLGEADFEEIEEWFSHLQTGTPIDHHRHSDRCEEAKGLLPVDPPREVDHGEGDG